MTGVTVRELVEKLSYLNPDAIVCLSRDPEGNTFTPFSGNIGTCLYSDSWEDVYFEDPDLDEPEDGIDAVVLWP